ncbi:hypothetical protein [Leucobacter aridicollis]|uniref:hypothetical protein n=1 Tax=Leucobacter aridicollis TaxID=283878 RepID=UPI00216A5465|nr:hypothetical protein [Leucobacter aridicollis]MCS3426731.1 hypothetical protein [Leucobacter aridicollis]
MLQATLRLDESIEFEVSGATLDEIHARIEIDRPEGFQLSRAPLRVTEDDEGLTAAGAYQRQDQTRQIVAATFEELWAQTPSGWTVVQVEVVP